MVADMADAKMDEVGKRANALVACIWRAAADVSAQADCAALSEKAIEERLSHAVRLRLAKMGKNTAKSLDAWGTRAALGTR